jgi:hypothetical protein
MERRTRIRAGVGAVALVAALGVALAAAIGATGQEPDPAGPEPALPQLTAEEVARAKAVVKGSPVLQQLGLHQAPVVAEVGVWHTSKTLDKLGAVVLLRLAEPARVKGAFPAIVYDDSERTRPPYSERVTMIDTADVTTLVGVVDLARDKLVALHPGPGGVVRSPEQPSRGSLVAGR